MRCVGFFLLKLTQTHLSFFSLSFLAWKMKIMNLKMKYEVFNKRRFWFFTWKTHFFNVSYSRLMPFLLMFLQGDKCSIWPEFLHVSLSSSKEKCSGAKSIMLDLLIVLIPLVTFIYTLKSVSWPWWWNTKPNEIMPYDLMKWTANWLWNHKWRKYEEESTRILYEGKILWKENNHQCISISWPNGMMQNFQYETPTMKM